MSGAKTPAQSTSGVASARARSLSTSASTSSCTKPKKTKAEKRADHIVGAAPALVVRLAAESGALLLLFGHFRHNPQLDRERGAGRWRAHFKEQRERIANKAARRIGARRRAKAQRDALAVAHLHKAHCAVKVARRHLEAAQVGDCQRVSLRFGASPSAD